MSLLHKNGILKEYRRQHREETAAALARQAAESATTDAAAHENDDDDEFPDVDAFQVVGSSPSAGATASPPLTRPSPFSVMSTMGEGTRHTTPSTAAKAASSPLRSVDDEGKSGASGASGGSTSKKERVGPPSLAIRTASSEESWLAKASKDASAAGHGASGAGSPLSNDEEEYNPAGAEGHEAAPLASPVESHPRAVPSPVASLQKSLGHRSRSDLTGEEHGAAKGSHLHSPGSDPTVSPTTLTAGVETFLTASEAAEGLNASRGFSLPPPNSGGGAALVAAQGHNAVNHTNNNTSGSMSRPVSSASGPPLSPFLSRPVRVAQAGQLHAVQSSSGVDGPGQTTVDVSCSSSSSFAAEPKQAMPADKGDSLMSEEAVARLGPNQTNNSMEGETMMTGGSPVRLRVDVSDTMLQPPTSILSEPSTLDTTTANLASLRSRSQARRAVERSAAGAAAAAGALGKQSSAPRTAAAALQHAPDGGQQTTAADGAAGNTIDDDDDDDVFSRVSVSEAADGVSSPLNGNASLIDTRIAVGPSHLLSFSGTARTLPRIGDDEDIDVDPSSVITDPTGRTQAALPPITFYEAYTELVKEMKHMPATKAQGQQSSGGASAAVGSSPAAHAAAAAPAGRNAHTRNKSKGGLLSLFGCCGPHEADIETRQPPAYATPSADLDRVGGASARSGGATSATTAVSSAEDELRVVQFLKTRALSLQNLTHRRMLFTVFNVLTGQAPWPHLKPSSGASNATAASPVSSARAVRWESIGFQGSNPATDVRATGVWGVLQLLYLLDYYPLFAKRLWDLCQNPAAAHRGSATAAAAAPPMPLSASSSPPRAANGVSNQLPFVLVCFNFTAVVLDAAGQHLLDAEIRKAKRSHLAAVVPVKGPNKPEDHLSGSPGTYICCEAFIGALQLFAEAWYNRPLARTNGAASPSSLPPLSRPSVADFGEIKAKLRSQIVHKGGAVLLQDAVEKLRAEALLGFS